MADSIRAKLKFEGEILLCEDSRMNQEIISERLTGAGFKTVTANDGKQGLEIVENRVKNGIKPFDIIFMDIFMPVMNGLEASAEIAKLNTGTPVIAVTPDNSPEDIERYAAHGITDCLVKPFTPQELLDCLMKYIKPVEPDNTQNDKKLNIKIINIFVRNNKNKHAEIIRAVDEGDIKLAHRLAHTLKSNAAMLEETRLQKAAAHIENLLANADGGGINTDMDAMGVLGTELDIALKKYEAVITGSDSVKTAGINPGDFDGTECSELLDKLEKMLGGGDSECLDLLDGLRAVPGSGELARQIEYFEFDKALKTLARLREELGNLEKSEETRT